MKRNTRIFIKTTSLVLAFMLLLGVGIMSLSFSHSGVKPNDNNFLTPDLAVTAPTSQELLQKKFNAYNTVTEENGKSVLTIFSEEQIKDFNDRRDNDEWFWLSSEEMLFLIDDTVKLFEEYDLVYIRDLDGNLKKYYGLSFFSSEEYYASFNGFDLGVTDASFDLNKDIYETIFKRVEIFNSANIYSNVDEIYYMFTDIRKALSKNETAQLSNGFNPWFEGYNQSKINALFGAWVFNEGEIHYANISDTNYAINSLNRLNIYTTDMLTDKISNNKYDRQSKNVVIELYNENTQQLIARLRLDENNNTQHINELEKMLRNFHSNMGGSNNAQQQTEYRAVAYFNGFDFGENTEDIAIVYCPDGDTDLSRFQDSGNVQFDNHYYWQTGFGIIAEYLNAIIYNQLND